jgi:hypothetical protein
MTALCIVGCLFLALRRHLGGIWLSRYTSRPEFLSLLIVFGLPVPKIVHLIDGWPFVFHWILPHFSVDKAERIPFPNTSTFVLKEELNFAGPLVLPTGVERRREQFRAINLARKTQGDVVWAWQVTR